jgi:hypothetical protein
MGESWRGLVLQSQRRKELPPKSVSSGARDAPPRRAPQFIPDMGLSAPKHDSFMRRNKPSNTPGSTPPTGERAPPCALRRGVELGGRAFDGFASEHHLPHETAVLASALLSRRGPPAAATSLPSLSLSLTSGATR